MRVMLAVALQLVLLVGSAAAQQQDVPPAEPAPAEETEEAEEADSAEVAETDDVKPTPAARGNNVAALLSAGGVACAAAPVLGCITAIPVLGVILSPVVIGGGMGLFGWVAGSLFGQKRLPVVPLVLAGVAGVLLSTVATLPGVLMMLGGLGLSIYGNEGPGSLVVLAGEAVVLVILGLGTLGTAAGIGALAALLGRGREAGESAVGLDLFTVAPVGGAPKEVEEVEEYEEYLEEAPED